MRCRRRFINQQRGIKGKVERGTVIARSVGKAVEAATTVSTPRERADIVMEHIGHLPLHEQKAAIVRTVELIERADELADDTVDSTKQVQFSWYDPRTGFTFKAKPDEVQNTTDDRGPVIRIIDDKTASKVSCRHRRNLYFFGFVVSKQLQEEQAQARKRGELYIMPSIQLVVRPLGKNSEGEVSAEQAFWYKRRREDSQLSEYRRIIGMMKEADERNEFPGKTDWDCDRCPFRQTCPEYLALETKPNEGEELIRIA
jgi:hypothetical protein